ncbi:MAG: hypothetical protein K8S27_00880 [Candidatus Omnitrophica bacterium]|nr:hypothetical protein [Candidatus Omnitrophota bacterium]
MESKTVRFFYMSRTIILILLLFVITSDGYTNPLPKNHHVVQFDNSRYYLNIPMLVDYTEKQEYFLNPFWGVKIINLYVDNKKVIRKETFPSFYDEPDTSTSKNFDGSFVYIRRCIDGGDEEKPGWEIISIEDINMKDFGFRYFYYAIPREAKHIQIHYQIRYADMSLSPLKIVDMWDILEKIPSE